MENSRENEAAEVDIVEIAGMLWSRGWLIFSVGLFVALLFFAVSRFLIAPVYESTTKIYILNRTESAAVTYSDVQLGTQLTKDYAELINSRYVLEEVIQKQSLPVDYRKLLKLVRVATPSDTRIVSITVEHTDPAEAMNIANCIREVASEHIQNVMDIDAVNVVETANMPTQKAGPSAVKWTLFGGIAGCLIMCGILLIQFLMDDTIKSSEDVEKYLGLSTLGLIPITASAPGAVRKHKKNKRHK